ncbi:hypothetical protein [Sphingobium sp. sgz301303]|uniref:hypothetical protein n=1 Tax=Sphingobium sp. sgz301303 TaxID=3342380 RepID=UPI0035A78B61
MTVFLQFDFRPCPDTIHVRKGLVIAGDGPDPVNAAKHHQEAKRSRSFVPANDCAGFLIVGLPQLDGDIVPERMAAGNASAKMSNWPQASCFI